MTNNMFFNLKFDSTTIKWMKKKFSHFKIKNQAMKYQKKNKKLGIKNFLLSLNKRYKFEWLSINNCILIKDFTNPKYDICMHYLMIYKFNIFKVSIMKETNQI